MMPRYLLDTNHAGMLLRGDDHPLWRRLDQFHQNECLLCRPVVAELWFMVYHSQRVLENRTRLANLLSLFSILEFSSDAAEEFGRLRNDLRRAGTPIPAFDVLIASITKVEECTLVSADRHFTKLPDLPIENWMTG